MRLATLCLIATPALSQTPTKPQEIATAAGTVVADLPGWRKTFNGPLLRFDAPEGDLRIAVVDVGASPDADSAAQAAWARFLPNAAPTLLATTRRSAKRGWDEQVGLRYEASADSPMEIYGTALRHGDAWTVVLVDGTRAAADKRDADIALVYFGLHPKGTRIITNSMPSVVATRTNADGSVSLVLVDPGADSISLIVGPEADHATRTLRNGQHVYLFKPVL